MRLIRPLLLTMTAGVVLSSCIKEEALNAEADITNITVKGTELIRKPVITNNTIQLYVNGWADVTHLAPVFNLTEGATIEPKDSTVRDFTQPQQYVVTSQDGQWKKAYTVSFIANNDIATAYHFETLKVDNTVSYDTFVDKTPDGGTFEWASGNSGVSFILSGKGAKDYPTSQSDDGYKGKCLKLTTISTGAVGALFGSPIAAGNLFTGSFELDFGDTGKSTHFGVPFRQTPLALVGYYKYKVGDKFTDKNQTEIKDRKDDFALYAVLFETGDGVEYLDGHNSLTSDRIVLKAMLEDRKETNEWTRFSIPFKAVDGRTIDVEKLKEGKYSLAIIMSSSKDGANFEGAVGSTLYVDELELFTK